MYRVRINSLTVATSWEQGLIRWKLHLLTVQYCVRINSPTLADEDPVTNDIENVVWSLAEGAHFFWEHSVSAVSA